MLRSACVFGRLTLAAESALSRRDASARSQDSAASSCRRCSKARRSTCRLRFRASRSRRRSQLLQEQDRILRTFPEVESVFGTVGRSDSATDNAPLDMYDTTVMLKPREQWRAGMTYEKLIQEMDAEAPVSGAVEHLDHARREPAGHGADRHQDAAWAEDSGAELLTASSSSASQIQQILSGTAASAVGLCRARVAGLLHQRRGEPRGGGALRADRRGRSAAPLLPASAARTSPRTSKAGNGIRSTCAISATSATISRQLRRVLIATPAGAQIPLEQVARISFSRGPAMIRDEDGALTGYVYIDLNTKDYGGFVDAGEQACFVRN